MQSVVATYTRDILVNLGEPAGWVANQRAGTLNLARVILDATDADQLDGGSLILVSKPTEPTTFWTIFARTEIQKVPNLIEFAIRGTINLALDASEFVSESYKFILDRSADEDGSAVYTNMITKGHLTHYDVLRILASSDEAQDRRERLLIVPGDGRDYGGVTMNPTIDGMPDRVFIVA